MSILLILLLAAQVSGESLEIHFIDVGNGDAVFIQSDTTRLLIDAGPPGQNLTANYLRDRGISDLDAVILTSPSPDRIGGFGEVLNTTGIAKYYESEFRSDLPDYLRIKEEFANRSIPREVLEEGEILPIGDRSSLEILQAARVNDTLTDDGMILAITSGTVRVLLLADHSPEVYTFDPAARIVRIPDHGSREGTDPGFFRKVMPEIAIISAEYDPDHDIPSGATLATLEGLPSTVYQTGLYGSVIIRTDGTEYTVETTKESLSGTLSLISAIETRGPE
jgi:beta-lactamase superfamily II metal-dependent hydrolase